MADSSPNRPLFASILDEAPTEVIKPKPMPIGTYLWVVTNRRYDKSTQKKTDFIEFELACLQPYDDVNIAELEAMGGVEGKSRNLTFYLTQDAVYRLDEFHEHCGIDLSSPMSRRQRNEMVLNAQVIGVIAQEIVTKESPDGDPAKAKTTTYANIVQTAKA